MTLIVKNPINIKDGDCFVYRYTICKNEEPLCDVEYESTLDIFSDSLDPALPVVLFPAMREGRDILFKGTISENLLSSTETIQNIFHMWYKKYSVVGLSADTIHGDGRQKRGVACFFTGGLDSSYTLVKNFEEITHLIYVDGFYDSRKGNEKITEAHLDHLRQFSRKIGKTLIEIKTNLRDFMDDYGIWGDHNHGAGLASIGLLLSKYFHKIYIASSHTYDVPLPWGSTPLMDPYWSNESVQFIHHGAEATRVQKTIEVAKNDTVLNSLRVCFGAVPNCGRCEKCVRTMIHLKIVGALDKCTAFLTKETLNPDYISRLYIKLRDVHTKAVFDENITALKEIGKDRELVEALEDCLNGVYRRKIRGFPKRVRNFFRRKVLSKLIATAD